MTAGSLARPWLRPRVSATFGRSVQAFDARQVQLALRFVFRIS